MFWFRRYSTHHLLHLVLDCVQRLEQQGECLMATLQEVQDAIAVLKVTIADEKAEVQAKLTALAVEVQTLKDQLVNGIHVTNQDLDDLRDQIVAIGTGVKDISEPTIPA